MPTTTKTADAEFLDAMAAKLQAIPDLPTGFDFSLLLQPFLESLISSFTDCFKGLSDTTVASKLAKPSMLEKASMSVRLKRRLKEQGKVANVGKYAELTLAAAHDVAAATSDDDRLRFVAAVKGVSEDYLLV